MNIICYTFINLQEFIYLFERNKSSFTGNNRKRQGRPSSVVLSDIFARIPSNKFLVQKQKKSVNLFSTNDRIENEQNVRTINQQFLSDEDPAEIRQIYTMHCILLFSSYRVGERKGRKKIPFMMKIIYKEHQQKHRGK